MLKQFDIVESENVLLLKLKSTGAVIRLIKELVIMVIGFIIVSTLSYESLITISSLLVVVYLLPLIRLPWLIKNIKVLLRPNIYRFDRLKDEFSINHEVKHACSEISGLAINYLTAYDSEEVYLDLSFSKSYRHRLSSGSSLNLKEYKKVGRELAHFCKVECWNNAPHAKELLWGTAQASDKDIAAINGRHSQYN